MSECQISSFSTIPSSNNTTSDYDNSQHLPKSVLAGLTVALLASCFILASVIYLIYYRRQRQRQHWGRLPSRAIAELPGHEPKQQIVMDNNAPTHSSARKVPSHRYSIINEYPELPGNTRGQAIEYADSKKLSLYDSSGICNYAELYGYREDCIVSRKRSSSPVVHQRLSNIAMPSELAFRGSCTELHSTEPESYTPLYAISTESSLSKGLVSAPSTPRVDAIEQLGVPQSRYDLTTVRADAIAAFHDQYDDTGSRLQLRSPFHSPNSNGVMMQNTSGTVSPLSPLKPQQSSTQNSAWDRSNTRPISQTPYLQQGSHIAPPSEMSYRLPAHEYLPSSLPVYGQAYQHFAPIDPILNSPRTISPYSTISVHHSPQYGLIDHNIQRGQSSVDRITPLDTSLFSPGSKGTVVGWSSSPQDTPTTCISSPIPASGSSSSTGYMPFTPDTYIGTQ